MGAYTPNSGNVEQRIDLVWSQENLVNLQQYPIAGEPSTTLATLGIDSNGRLTATRSATPPSRELVLFPQTAGLVDYEIRTTWYRPSNDEIHGSYGFQYGLVARATVTDGIVFDQNVITAPSTTFLAHWNWNLGWGGTLNVLQNVNAANTTNQTILVTSAKIAYSTYLVIGVNTTNNLYPGDNITISGTGITQLDGNTYKLQGVYPTTNSFWNNPGPCVVIAGYGGTAFTAASTPPLTAGATVAPVTAGNTPSSYDYPQHVAMRVRNTYAEAKKWRVGTPEPPWNPYMLDAGSSVATTFTDGVPTSGMAGLMYNHAAPGDVFTFGDVTVTPIR
ncbi:MAG: hypothetical protein JSR64_17100 [Nitrospira sp.]|nr:hypothetical protein [Nitrospira sp.]